MKQILALLLLTACNAATTPVQSLTPADTPGGPIGKHAVQTHSRTFFGLKIPFRVRNVDYVKVLELGCSFGFSPPIMHKRWNPYNIEFPKCTRQIEAWKVPPPQPSAAHTCFFNITGSEPTWNITATNPSPLTHCRVREGGLAVY